MYPHSFLWWVGGTAIVMGILGLVGLLALAVENWLKKRDQKDEEGRSSVWYVFEVLSAIFVIAGLLTMIYSDSQLLRAIGGTAYLVVVSAAAAYYVSESKRQP